MENISNGIPYGAYTRVVREDQSKKGLLYLGTELGVYISWNDGVNWEPLQLNLPVTPITDLKVHKGDLIVATSGRGFWILDDLGLLSQSRTTKELNLYQPEETVYGTWGSELNSNNPNFDGENAFEGVNPANGVVIYYNLPKLDKEAEVTLEIRNSKNELINTLSSKSDKNYKSWAGGPPSAQTLSKKVGLNRFVWNMTYPIMSGASNVYIEASYRGHRVIPGTYALTLKVTDKTVSEKAIIKENPLYETKAGQYEEYDAFMKVAEATLTDMHIKVNMLNKAKYQLKKAISQLKKSSENNALIEEGEKLVKELTSWDEDMVQRKSKAYDDVENFPNKFTAEYIFLINQTESSIPRVNDQNKKRKTELDAQWNVFNARANVFINTSIPDFNKKLWNAGIGAINMD